MALVDSTALERVARLHGQGCKNCGGHRWWGVGLCKIHQGAGVSYSSRTERDWSALSAGPERVSPGRSQIEKRRRFQGGHTAAGHGIEDLWVRSISPCGTRKADSVDPNPHSIGF